MSNMDVEGYSDRENTDIMISVLMPVYRTKVEYLREALQSILNQTYRNFELLIVYEPIEGDGIKEELEAINDKRVSVLLTPPQYGLPRSLNMGLEKAKGKYIARMDADDVAFQDRLEKQLNYMESNGCETEVLGSSVYDMLSDAIAFDDSDSSPQEKAVSVLFDNCPIAHPTAFIRRDFLETNGIRYDERLRAAEDYHLWVDVIIHGGRIRQLKEPLIKYRLHGENAGYRFLDEMEEWRAYSKRDILNAVGEFTEEEHYVLQKYWYPHTYRLSDYQSLFRRIVSENTKTHIFDERVLKRRLKHYYVTKVKIEVRDKLNILNRHKE